MKTKHQPILSAPVTQSGDQKLNNPIRRGWFALGLGGFLFTLVFALLPSSAHAGCSRWDVSGNWVLQQASGINENVSLQQGKWGQHGANLTGTAAVTLTASSNSSFTKPQYAGVISGKITDNAFTMLITRDTAQYRYTGTVGPSGEIDGTTENGVHWVSSRRMKCADENPPISKQKAGNASPTPSAEADESSPVKPKPDATKSTSAAADDWINQELRKRKTATQPTPSASNRPRGFINGLQMPTPTPSAQADESSSSDTDDEHGKHKKNKKKKKHHHHHDDDENQGND